MRKCKRSIALISAQEGDYSTLLKSQPRQSNVSELPTPHTDWIVLVVKKHHPVPEWLLPESQCQSRGCNIVTIKMTSAWKSDRLHNNSVSTGSVTLQYNISDSKIQWIEADWTCVKATYHGREDPTRVKNSFQKVELLLQFKKSVHKLSKIVIHHKKKE